LDEQRAPSFHSLFETLYSKSLVMAANAGGGRQAGGNQGMNEHVEFSVSADDYGGVIAGYGEAVLSCTDSFG
jgi:hypothetical protein